VRGLNVKILTSGALVEVQLSPSQARRTALLRQKREVPPPVRVLFLIDTGASVSMVDESYMRTLQLDPTGATQFHSSSTNGVAQRAAMYDVHLVLGGVAGVNTLRFDPLAMMATALINQPFEGILGRDVLARLQLAWNGPGQEVRISYV
jgi:hypothetical protein